jgi:hypothetical protein
MQSQPMPLVVLPCCTQVKNVSGRLLVGLRWWNEVSESGGSEWRFETLQEGQRAVDKKDSFVFWAVLYVIPALWVVLGVVAVLKLNFDYLLLVVIAILLSSANLTGYLKCSKAQRAQIKGMASGLFASGLRVRGCCLWGWLIHGLHVAHRSILCVFGCAARGDNRKAVVLISACGAAFPHRSSPGQVLRLTSLFSVRDAGGILSIVTPVSERCVCLIFSPPIH